MELGQERGVADLIADTLFAPHQNILALKGFTTPQRRIEVPPFRWEGSELPTGLVVFETVFDLASSELQQREIVSGGIVVGMVFKEGLERVDPLVNPPGYPIDIPKVGDQI